MIFTFHEYFAAGVQAYNLADYHWAIIHFSNAIELQPETTAPYTYRSNSYKRLGYIDKALADLTKLIELKYFEGIYEARGGLYSLQSEYNKAVEDFTEALQHTKDKSHVYHERGKAKLLLINYAAAKEDFLLSIQHDHNPSGALLSLADVTFLLEDYEASDQALTSYLHRIKPTKDILSQQATVRTKLKNWQGAIEVYNAALEIDNTSPAIYFRRGEAYFELEKFDLAMQDYDRALEIDPTFHYAFNSKGLIYFSLKMFDKALQAYSKAIEIKPDDPICHYNFYKVKVELKDLTGALDSAKTALALKYESAILYLDLANILMQLFKFEEAIHYFTKYISLEPSDNAARISRASCQFELNRSTTELDEIEEILSQKEHGLSISQLSYAYLLRGNMKETLGQSAVDDFHKAITIDENNYLAHNNLGLALLKTNPQESLSYLEKAIKLNPEHQTIQENYAKVKLDAEQTHSHKIETLQHNEMPQELTLHPLALEYEKAYQSSKNSSFVYQMIGIIAALTLIKYLFSFDYKKLKTLFKRKSKHGKTKSHQIEESEAILPLKHNYVKESTTQNIYDLLDKLQRHYESINDLDSKIAEYIATIQSHIPILEQKAKNNSALIKILLDTHTDTHKISKLKNDSKTNISRVNNIFATADSAYQLAKQLNAMKENFLRDFEDLEETIENQLLLNNEEIALELISTLNKQYSEFESSIESLKNITDTLNSIDNNLEAAISKHKKDFEKTNKAQQQKSLTNADSTHAMLLARLEDLESELMEVFRSHVHQRIEYKKTVAQKKQEPKPSTMAKQAPSISTSVVSHSFFAEDYKRPRKHLTLEQVSGLGAKVSLVEACNQLKQTLSSIEETDNVIYHAIYRNALLQSCAQLFEVAIQGKGCIFTLEFAKQFRNGVYHNHHLLHDNPTSSVISAKSQVRQTEILDELKTIAYRVIEFIEQKIYENKQHLSLYLQSTFFDSLMKSSRDFRDLSFCQNQITIGERELEEAKDAQSHLPELISTQARDFAIARISTYAAVIKRYHRKEKNTVKKKSLQRVEEGIKIRHRMSP